MDFSGLSTAEKNKKLLQVATEGDVSKAHELIANGANARAKNDNGWTPLHWAGQNGHAAVIEALLASGADVNAAEDPPGDAPLHLASGVLGRS